MTTEQRLHFKESTWTFNKNVIALLRDEISDIAMDSSTIVIYMTKKAEQYLQASGRKRHVDSFVSKFRAWEAKKREYLKIFKVD